MSFLVEKRAYEFFAYLVIMLSLWIFASTAHSASFCVSTTEELQDALDEAAVNWTNDYINVVQGTYTGSFSFSSHQHWPIAIRGGYTPNCTDRVEDPTNTLFDSGGLGTVLSIYQHAGGGVFIVGLTIQNGGYWGLWVRLINEFDDNTIEGISLIHNIIKDNRGHGGVYMMSELGQGYGADPILIYDNIIAGNVGSTIGGVSVITDWDFLESYIVFRNNIIVGNISSDSNSGVHASTYSKGNIYLTNNTITQNQTFSAHSSASGGLRISVGSGLYAYNNIIRGNKAEVGADDIYVFYSDGSGTGEGFYNNYSEMLGNWTDEGYNVNVDPGFVNPGFWHDNGTINQPEDDYWVEGDYHLYFTSECIDAGTNDAPYLPLSDLGAALLRRPFLTVSGSLYCLIFNNYPYLITFR